MFHLLYVSSKEVNHDVDKLFSQLFHVLMKVISLEEENHLRKRSQTSQSSHAKKQLLKLYLEVNFDHKLNFGSHISDLCRKASSKINALARMADIAKRRTLMNAFFKSRFSYFLVIWMIKSHKDNKRIRKLHESCLRIICNNTSSYFDQF